MHHDFAGLAPEYDRLWATMVVDPTKLRVIDHIAGVLIGSKTRYQVVAESTGVPWAVIALIHEMECSGNFRLNLANGDSLLHRTVHVPAGRPVRGLPPFTWEVAAEDALCFQQLNLITDWSIARICFELEGYNGWGSRAHGIATPYLWSYSNHYTRGKYVRDGVYDANAVSQQMGAMPLFKRMMALDSSIVLA